jgi:hypothetical protein
VVTAAQLQQHTILVWTFLRGREMKVVLIVLCLGLIAVIGYVAQVNTDQARIILEQQERIEELSTVTMGNVTITIEPKIEEEGKTY